MAEETQTIAVNETVSISALRRSPEAGASPLVFVYAPGAGSTLGDPFGAYAARGLAEAGIESWRFQFPYMEARRMAPDSPAVLEATWSAVIAAVEERSEGRLVAGGRSMGGRIASQIVAKGAEVAGLALFAYPLVPPGRPNSARTEHLPAIAVPTLFCSGTRDSFGSPEQLAEAAALVPGARLHLLEGADHGFAALKASGRTREDVWREATEALIEFMRGIETAG